MLSFNSYGGSFIDFSLSDFCYQQPDVQDRGGVYYFPNESVGITASSLCVYKDLYGQYMSKVELLNGQFDGKFIRWWENGGKHQEKNYKDGKLDGKWTETWSGGRVMFERNYTDGNLDTETTFSYYDNGQIETKYNYKDTHLDGEQTVWYKNGQIKLQYNASGLGKATGWYENGQIKSDGIFNDGKLDGKETSWYENGQMRGESNYKDGKKDGKWTWWLSDGLKWKEAIFINDEIVGDCEYFNVAGPWDEYTKEGFLIPDLCPNQSNQDLLEAEILALELAEEKAKANEYLKLLEEELKAEHELAMKLIEQDKLNVLKSAYVNNIAARIKTNWRYQAAEDDWSCEVYVIQDRQGQVKAVDVRNCNVGDSSLAKSFRDSIERAVYKASPLPAAPDESVFDSEMYMLFSVN